MTDITQNITAPDRYLLRTTRRIGMLSYKSAKVRFDHRTTVQGISFPPTFRLTEEELTRTFSQFYLSDGNQSLSITGKVEAEFPDTITTGSPPWAEVLISIKAVDRYWNRVTGEWEVGFYANRFGMTDTEGAVGEETDIKFEANINLETGLIPDLPGDELEIIFYVARSTNTDPVVISNYSDFINFQLTINNPAVEEGQNTAIDYQLTQQSAARGRYDDGSIWFGDGPTAYARSAITRDEAGDELTSEWRFSDETTPIIHANILLREVMDMKRTQVRGLTADLLGEYKPCKMPNIDDFFHFFIGGNQNGKDNKWAANLFRLNRVTDTPDPLPDMFYWFDNFGQDSAGSFPSNWSLVCGDNALGELQVVSDEGAYNGKAFRFEQKGEISGHIAAFNLPDIPLLMNLEITIRMKMVALRPRFLFYSDDVGRIFELSNEENGTRIFYDFDECLPSNPASGSGHNYSLGEYGYIKFRLVPDPTSPTRPLFSWKWWDGELENEPDYFETQNLNSNHIAGRFGMGGIVSTGGVYYDWIGIKQI